MEISIIKSKRKTISIRVVGEDSIEVRAPLRMSRKAILKFVEEHDEWIQKNLTRQRQKQEQLKDISVCTGEELKALGNRACRVIPERVRYFAPLIGVDYGRITIRNQRTLWGSCSAKGNLSFNVGLMCVPPEVLDYVVVHELCHRKEMNHSKRFWKEVARFLPDYADSRRWLKEHGAEVLVHTHGSL